MGRAALEPFEVIARLQRANAKLVSAVQRLSRDTAKQAKTIERLEARIAELTRLLDLARIGGSTAPQVPSGQIPPFKKPDASRRSKSKGKPGRKPGHEGTTRAAPAVIDREELHETKRCPHCDHSLTPLKAKDGQHRFRYRIIEDIVVGASEAVRHGIGQYWCGSCHARVEPVVVDAMPVDQFVKDGGWHMRMVGLVDGRLAFALAPDPTRALAADAPAGALLEVRHDGAIATLARRIVQHGGAALVIDYGHAETAFGDTLQAVRGHQYADPLAGPGESDLTAQVDFAALARTARRAGATVHDPVAQGAFLRRLGIAARAARLKASATPQQAADIDAALARLTAPDQMGELFKVLAIADPKLGALPGFDGAS